MKAFLMYPDRDFDLDAPEPANAEDLVADLGLGTLFDAMSGGDAFLATVARSAVLSGLTEPEDIAYRQRILDDCLAHPEIAREIYDLAGEAIAGEKKIYRSFARTPGASLRRALEALELFVPTLTRLRQLAGTDGALCGSAGLTAFFGMLGAELDDDFFHAVEEHLRELKFSSGVLISAQLGQGLRGETYILRRPNVTHESLLHRVMNRPPAALTYKIPDRDENGGRALSQLRDRGLNHAANALAGAIEHILSFFLLLRTELGFYVGCVNLHEHLTGKSEPTCVPVPRTDTGAVLDCRGLYDVALSLSLEGRAVGNDVAADGRPLVVITGANRGGKSTLLRSAGQAQLMMQCGMFVPATAFRAPVCNGVFTHYRREEDATMSSGKLDEELQRMSTIVDQVAAGSVLLCNESFASTNEREGSEIARQIIRALLETGVRVIFVTHMYDLAHSWYVQDDHQALFLRAERSPAGHRSFKLSEGEPLATSYGADLYRRIFATPEPG